MNPVLFLNGTSSAAFNRSLPNLAECGFPLIIDYVMESPVWLKECVEALSSHSVYFIGVKCPLEELERREQARGDRQIGFARWQYDRVHQYGAYDLEIDTFQSTPEDCALRPFRATRLVRWVPGVKTPG
jgi:chloramphenicol 3-O phosphotransferase